MELLFHPRPPYEARDVRRELLGREMKVDWDKFNRARRNNDSRLAGGDHRTCASIWPWPQAVEGKMNNYLGEERSSDQLHPSNKARDISHALFWRRYA